MHVICPLLQLPCTDSVFSVVNHVIYCQFCVLCKGRFSYIHINKNVIYSTQIPSMYICY